MGEVVSLRRARKRRAAVETETKAAARRVEFGISKSAKSNAKVESIKAAARLESHRIEEPRDAD
jgi:hypothetical protein